MKSSSPIEPKYSDIGYFRHLNAMRFFAAFLVLVHHAEQIRMKEAMVNFKEFSIANFGFDAVVFFFVLSGFLITYLLLKERRATGEISIKKFYQRRVVRIWPLYFLLVVLGLWVVPAAIHLIGYPYTMPYTTGESLPYFIFFMPFMVNILYGHSLLEPLWSIGVEELFYLWWAPAVKWVKKYLLALLLSVITLKYLLLALIYFEAIEVSAVVNQIISTLMFEAMAVGGVAAYLLFGTKGQLSKKMIFAPVVQWVVAIFILARIFARTWLSEWSEAFDVLFNMPIVSQFVMIVAFAYIVVALAVSERSIAGLRENRLLSKLGEISYGVYMYHMLVIFAVMLIGRGLLDSCGALLSTAIYYILVVGITIAVSALSKRLIEDKFLKLKKY